MDQQQQQQQSHQPQDVNHNSSSNHNILPYISVEGRRKRRRTTVEDAFDSLTLGESRIDTMVVQDASTSPPLPPPPPPFSDSHTSHANASTSDHPWQSPSSTPEMNFIKRLKYDTPERNSSGQNSYDPQQHQQKQQQIEMDFSSPMSMHQNDTSMEAGYGYGYGCHSIRRRGRGALQNNATQPSHGAFFEDGGDTNVVVDNDADVDYDSAASCTSTTSSQNSMSPEQEHSKAMYQLLFAPRKSKGGGRTPSPLSPLSPLPVSQALPPSHDKARVDQDCRNNDPVDLRLEELIRHSRIQAYVQQQHQGGVGIGIGVGGDEQHQQSTHFGGDSSCPTLRQLHKQQSHAKNGDCGDVYGTMGYGLRRKNSKIEEAYSSFFGGSCSGGGGGGGGGNATATRDDFHIVLPKSRPNTPIRSVKVERGRSRTTGLDRSPQQGRSRRSKSLPREVTTCLGVDWNNNPTKQSDMEMTT
jgi:hypothetical protein